jgi:Flp pilus assembly protein TadG
MRAWTRVPGLGRFARCERGTQLVELALVLPILLLFFAATAEFGRYFYTYSTLAKATRAGARYLATTPINAYGASGGYNKSGEDARAKRLVVYGDPNAADGSKPLVPGLTVDNVELTRSGKIASVPETVTVRIVNYNYTPLFNLGNFVNNVKWVAPPVKAATTMRFMLSQPTPPAA